MLTYPQTLAELLAARLEQCPHALALHLPDASGGCLTRTWHELAQDIAAMLGVLRHCRVAHGEHVAQLAENSYEWILVDFACLLYPAVHVPLHASLAGAQALEQIVHSGARLVFVSSADQAKKLASVRSTWPASLRFVSHHPCHGLLGDAWLGQTDQLLSSARQDNALPLAAPPTVDANTLATILYTSGTTGEPKGVMLTHGNLASNAIGSTVAFGEQPHEVQLSFLPLSHVFARTCDLYSWLVRGGELVIASSRDRVLAECMIFQPTLINGVPYFYERIYRSLREQQLTETPGILLKMLGGKMRLCNSGGAKLPVALFDFFQEQGVPLLEGYGLSETSPVITLSTPDAFRRGSVGQTIAHVEVSIAEDGEVLTRGPHVMHGYYNAPKATQDIIASGWLKTGDLGHLDEDGFLYITGRKKELIVLSSGKNIAPVYLETLLTAHPAIAQAMVVGDNRSYLAALVVLAYPVAHDKLASILRDSLVDCSHHEQVRRFHVVPQPFSIERDELTPKLSLRRQVIAQHYAAEIAAMYATAPE